MEEDSIPADPIRLPARLPCRFHHEATLFTSTMPLPHWSTLPLLSQAFLFRIVIVETAKGKKKGIQEEVFITRSQHLFQGNFIESLFFFRSVYYQLVASCYRSLHPDRRDEGLDRAMAYQRESPKILSAPPGQQGSAGANVNDSTLTAASLIDAIITHQINQSSNPADLGPGGTNSKSDNFFNRYRRNASPVDSRGPDSRGPDPRGPDPRGPDPRGPDPRHKERHEEPPPGMPPQRPPSSSPSLPPPGSSSKAAFTLGEHIESIIAKDFHQGSGPVVNEQDWNPDWQRRQAEYQKSRMAAPESLLNDYAKSRMAAAAAADYAAKCRAGEGAQQLQDYGPPRGGGGGGEPDPRQPAISPLDYVKKKIVEVMRTSSDGSVPAGGASANHEMAPPSSPARRGISPAPSPNKRPRMNEDERGGPSPVVPHYLSAPYPTMGYPYSIPPNVPMSSAPTVATSASTSSAGNQPVVLLSAQYEPLSDED